MKNIAHTCGYGGQTIQNKVWSENVQLFFFTSNIKDEGYRCTRTHLLDVNRGDDGVHGVLNVVVHQVLILIKCFNEFIVFEIIYQLN